MLRYLPLCLIGLLNAAFAESITWQFPPITETNKDEDGNAARIVGYWAKITGANVISIENNPVGWSADLNNGFFKTFNPDETKSGRWPEISGGCFEGGAALYQTTELPVFVLTTSTSSTSFSVEGIINVITNWDKWQTLDLAFTNKWPGKDEP